MDNNSAALKTLLYFDIFDYPLTKEEILDFSSGKIEFEELKKNPLIEFYKSYYFLKGKKGISIKRIKNKKINNLKIQFAKKIAKKISVFPTVKLIGISGSLSMKNSSQNDDIDFFIITSIDFVWFTRLACVVYLIFLGIYRKKNELNVKNKICLNLIIGEDNVSFPLKKQNMYLAHEIVQLMPLFERNNIYKIFLESNSWLFKYLPNYENRTGQYKFISKFKYTNLEIMLLNFFKFFKFEKLSKVIQWQYMKNSITKEKISNKILAFHPKDYEKETLISYDNKISSL